MKKKNAFKGHRITALQLLYKFYKMCDLSAFGANSKQQLIL